MPLYLQVSLPLAVIIGAGVWMAHSQFRRIMRTMDKIDASLEMIDGTLTRMNGTLDRIDSLTRE